MDYRHGHVTPRPDGYKANCGGPEKCARCAREWALTQRSVPSRVREAREHDNTVEARYQS